MLFTFFLKKKNENPAVKKALLSLLATCVTKFKHESGTRVLADLYDLGIHNGRRAVSQIIPFVEGPYIYYGC